MRSPYPRCLAVASGESLRVLGSRSTVRLSQAGDEKGEAFSGSLVSLVSRNSHDVAWTGRGAPPGGGPPEDGCPLLPGGVWGGVGWHRGRCPPRGGTALPSTHRPR